MHYIDPPDELHSSEEPNPYLDGELLKALKEGTLVAIKTYSNDYSSAATTWSNWGTTAPTNPTSTRVVATTSNITLKPSTGTVISSNTGNSWSVINSCPNGVSSNSFSISYAVSKERYAYGLKTIEHLYNQPDDLGLHQTMHDINDFQEKLTSEDGLPLFGTLLHDALYTTETGNIIGVHHWLQVLVEEKVLYFDLSDIMLSRNEEERTTAIELNNVQSFGWR